MLRDRQALSRLATDGRIENDYTLKLANMLEQPRRFRLRVEGPADLRVDGPTDLRVAGADTFDVPAASVRPLPVTLSAAGDTGLRGAQPIRLIVEAVDGAPARVVEKTAFILP